MYTVNSFDIFDTLLARTVRDPTDIFDIIEKTLNYDNFKTLRLTAQWNSDQTMDSIYQQFKLLTGESDDKIKVLRSFELKTEMENTIPIISNILKIKDGDILVSDMYLSHDEIISLLNYHKINPNITLFVSPGGKGQGYMWEKLIKQYKINNHIGDNYHSDIVMSSKYGIEGTHTQIYKFSYLEDKLLSLNFELCSLLRRFRLMNPYADDTLEYKIYDQQIQYNIPLLLFTCKKLETILVSENRTKVLFLSRDGCLIYKLFSFLYPQYKSVYFYSSRFVNRNYNNDYVEYLKSNYTEDSIIFDLHGAFVSARKLYMNTFGHLPRVFIFNFQANLEEQYYDKITYVTKFGCRIELFNQDLHGSAIEFKENKIIRLPTEAPIKHIRIMHETVENFIKFIDNKSLLINSSIFLDDSFWASYYTDKVVYCEQLLINTFEHHERMLTFLADYYCTDKGSKYACAHRYTDIYPVIISDILDNCNVENGIDMMEIGLSREMSDKIPSIRMWVDYFNYNLNITGFDINPDFIKFDSEFSGRLKIIIGDQSNESDLQKLKYKKYELIIDDGSHASKDQQISFKTLWESVKPGGYYVIENLHYQPYGELCLKTKSLFENWKCGNWIESEYICSVEIDIIRDEIESINFYDSQSKNWGDSVKNAFVYIKKR